VVYALQLPHRLLTSADQTPDRKPECLSRSIAEHLQKSASARSSPQFGAGRQRADRIQQRIFVGGISVAEALWRHPQGCLDMPKILALVFVLIAAWRPFAGPTLSVPNRPDTLKFAVLGDNGSGDAAKYDVANQLAAFHRLFAFGLVIMLGDNFYGSQTPVELARKFDRPY
jgi:hypothetical protein